MAAKAIFHFAATIMLCARLVLAADIQVQIPENAAIGSEVVRINSGNETSGNKTGDDSVRANGSAASGQNVFQIVSGNKHERFLLDASSGLVTVAGALDRTIDYQYHLDISEVTQVNKVSAVRHVQVRIDVTDVTGYPPVYNVTCATSHVTGNKGLMLDVSLDVFLSGVETKDTIFSPPGPNAQVAVDTDNDHCGMTYADVWGTTFISHLNDVTSRVFCEHARNYPPGSRDVVTSPITINIIRPPFRADDPIQKKLIPATWSLLFSDAWVRRNSPHVVLDMTVGHLRTGRWAGWVCRATGDPLDMTVYLALTPSGCPAGKYGGRCDRDCVCRNGASCHPFNGACRCVPGWKGVACDIDDPTVAITPSMPGSHRPGQRLSLTCHAHNVDVRTMSWTKEGAKMPLRMVVYRSQPNPSLTLKIGSLEPRHEGTYACAVIDTDGTERRATYTVHFQKRRMSADRRGLLPWALACILCACVAAIVVAAVAAAILIRKRRDRAEQEDSILQTWLKENAAARQCWERKCSDLVIQGHVGQGAFCQVTMATLTCGTSAYKVAAKSVRPDQRSSLTARRDLLKEVALLSDFHNSSGKTFKINPDQTSVHPNIARFYGFVVEKDTMHLLMEFAPHGDLHNYLTSCRHLCIESGTLTVEQDMEFVTFALDVSKALVELHRQKIVHRDLAARNVLICENRVAKVTDFGLSRDIYLEREYVTKTAETDDTRLPIRWMALESLQDGTFTTKTDIWSFGILLWEIATLGGTPYPGMSADREIITWLEEGNVMEVPEDCCHELGSLMSSCWSSCPESRPTGQDIVGELGSLLGLGAEGYFFAPVDYESLADAETEMDADGVTMETPEDNNNEN